MRRRTRLLAPEERNVERKLARAEDRDVGPRAAEVLRLQRAAGNEAVTGLLARQGEAGLPRDDRSRWADGRSRAFAVMAIADALDTEHTFV